MHRGNPYDNPCTKVMDPTVCTTTDDGSGVAGQKCCLLKIEEKGLSAGKDGFKRDSNGNQVKDDKGNPVRDDSHYEYECRIDDKGTPC